MIPGAGGYYDPADRPGLATFVAAMIREGTTIAQLGGDLARHSIDGRHRSFVSSGASSTGTQIFGSALTQTFPNCFDVTSDIVLHPAFAPTEWERYRTRTKTTFVQMRTNPGFSGQRAFQPGGIRLPSGGPCAVERRSARRRYAAGVGRFPSCPLRARLRGDRVCRRRHTGTGARTRRAEFRRMAESWGAEPKVDDPAPIKAPRIYLISRPGSVQTTLFVGTQALARTSPDYLPLSVANRVLGGGMGRLFRHLREEKGYTYGIGSFISPTPYIGSWTASTSVRTNVTEPALHDLLAEIAQMRDSLVPPQEFENAKRSLVAAFALSLESPQQVLNYYLESWTYGLPANYWDTYPERVSSVTASQVAAAAQKVLGSVPPSDRGRGRCVEDSRHPGQAWSGGGLRRGRQSHAVMWVSRADQ